MPSNKTLRSNRPGVFCKKGILRNFTKFIGKNLCLNLFFNKVASLRPVTLLKRRLRHCCFPVNFAKFLRTPFIIIHQSQSLFFNNLFLKKKRYRHRCFPVNFAKFLWTSFYKTPPVVGSVIRILPNISDRIYCGNFAKIFSEI